MAAAQQPGLMCGVQQNGNGFFASELSFHLKSKSRDIFFSEYWPTEN